MRFQVMYVPGVSAGGSIVLMLIRVGDILSPYFSSLWLSLSLVQPQGHEAARRPVHLSPCCSETCTLGAIGRMLLFGFRTFKMDFTVCEEHCSLSSLGPVQPRNKSAQAQPLKRDVVPGRSGQSQKSQVALLRSAFLLAAPPPEGREDIAPGQLPHPELPASVLGLTGLSFVHSSISTHIL